MCNLDNIIQLLKELAEEEFQKGLKEYLPEDAASYLYASSCLHKAIKNIKEINNNPTENIKKIKETIKKAKSKISLKVWSNDYAKGYCYAILNNTDISNENYDYYSKQIDEL